MKHKKPLVDLPKARRVQEDNKAKRLKHAAELSRIRTATEICTELGISTRTLKRYMADPLWKTHGGIQLELTQRGRPTRDTLSRAEKRTLAEAHTHHEQGHTWIQVAEIMEIPIDRIKYLLKKQRAENKTEKNETA